MITETAKIARRLCPLELQFGAFPHADPTYQLRLLDLMTPAAMSQDTYLALQHYGESLDMSVAQGTDCVDGFDETHRVVHELLDASPWTMHPDYGCVTVTEARERDGTLLES